MWLPGAVEDGGYRPFSETLLERPAAALPSPRSRQRRRDSHGETRGAHAYITGNGRGCSPKIYRPDLVGAKVSGLVTPMPSPFAVSCYIFQRGVFLDQAAATRPSGLKFLPNSIGWICQIEQDLNEGGIYTPFEWGVRFTSLV